MMVAKSCVYQFLPSAPLLVVDVSLLPEAGLRSVCLLPIRSRLLRTY
jgi:hypothetical protein